jgi:type I restriction enzyme, S subunit
MSSPRYQAYKKAAASWLVELPSHWELIRLRFVCRISTGGRDTADAVPEGEFPFFVRSQTVERINSTALNCEAVLTAGDGVGVGKVFHHHVGPFDFHQRVYAFTEFKNISGRFFHLYLKENFHKVALEGNAKSTVDSLRMPVIANFQFCVPPIDEQNAIVDFLDRETAKIDALVDEQKRLIELLKEKRQAVISHAVTKGLDPNAPMKDSGVEWLGLVPEHWEVRRVKSIVNSIEQGWSPQCETTPANTFDEWAVLKVGCVNTGSFDPFENKALPADLEPQPSLVVNEGDLLISRANTRDLVGRAAVVDRYFPKLMLCDKLYRLRLSTDLCCPSFLGLFLGTPQARGQVEISATGASSSMLNIGQATILEMPLPVPPLQEQREILQHVADATKAHDALSQNAIRSIQLLQERRSALVSAAVTGKIDVRGTADAKAVAA